MFAGKPAATAGKHAVPDIRPIWFITRNERPINSLEKEVSFEKVCTVMGPKRKFQILVPAHGGVRAV